MILDDLADADWNLKVLSSARNAYKIQISNAKYYAERDGLKVVFKAIEEAADKRRATLMSGEVQPRAEPIGPRLVQ